METRQAILKTASVISPASRKVAIVTGAGRGIGRAITDRLCEDGLVVVGCSRGARPEDLRNDVTWVTADVSRSEDAQRLTDTAIKTFGNVSVLVNNAGVQIEKTVVDTSDDDWDQLVGINCKGVFNMCRSVLPHMVETGGAIVNLGSISGLVSDGKMACYNASKAFVHALTRSIAVDHGPFVRCNAVCPGWIMTEMATDGFAMASDPQKAEADATRRHVVGRLGKPEDVANMISWLVSDQAGFVTGQCYVVDGGVTAASPVQPGFF